MFQRLVDILYRYPKSNLKRFKHFGGYLNYRKMIASRKLMEKAAFQLPPVNSHANALSIYFLTGKKYLYQTLFCIRSLTKASNEQFQFAIVDDGSFDAHMIGQINRLLPGAEIITQKSINQNLEKNLPWDKYPVLRNKRNVYPHLKKLTDIHTLPAKGWKLVLDSDMFFWDNPTEIVSWLKNPQEPLHMIDCVESYGYSARLMESLTGTIMKPLVNVGTIGLNSEAIDWEKLELWTKELEAKEGTTYYLEQALTAMIIGNSASVALDTTNYIVNPLHTSTGVLHHYVDLSKEYYFKSAWKKFI
ncbi:hypothetical protein [Mucilaginibacter dorajii]|nr:hypothetical protein [Mucilaginibacter dorajii]MCS3732772.1 hypothetical protein [Mucilaginibacter dorajii]